MSERRDELTTEDLPGQTPAENAPAQQKKPTGQMLADENRSDGGYTSSMLLPRRGG